MREKTIIHLVFILALLSQCTAKKDGIIMTVNGPVPAWEMGVTLTHEHILVDFIGADSITDNRWDDQKVIERVLPYMMRIRTLGCRTFVECTPAFLGRDPLLLKYLSDKCGMNIITNTGYYGAGNDKYLPEFAFAESADQLSERWITEWYKGIGGTGIRPGFIKIGVGSGTLSELHKKLVMAAARTHLQTGGIIASHTGPAIPAFEELNILKEEGVSPEAFIWVHAQNEKDLNNHIKAAKMGAWIGLDGLNDNNTEAYVRMIKNLKDNNLLNKVLLSHDAGWYHPGEKNGGDFRGFTTLFEKLVPLLRKQGFSRKDINQLIVINPQEAFTVRIRKLN